VAQTLLSTGTEGKRPQRRPRRRKEAGGKLLRRSFPTVSKLSQTHDRQSNGAAVGYRERVLEQGFKSKRKKETFTKMSKKKIRDEIRKKRGTSNTTVLTRQHGGGGGRISLGRYRKIPRRKKGIQKNTLEK